MSGRISATEAARNFSELLNRVRFRGESFDVIRNGEVVARISSAAGARRATADTLIAVLAEVGHADPAFSSDLERIQDEQPTLSDDPWAS